jgi:hypothetical protein
MSCIQIINLNESATLRSHRRVPLSRWKPVPRPQVTTRKEGALQELNPVQQQEASARAAEIMQQIKDETTAQRTRHGCEMMQMHSGNRSDKMCSG